MACFDVYQKENQERSHYSIRKDCNYKTSKRERRVINYPHFPAKQQEKKSGKFINLGCHDEMVVAFVLTLDIKEEERENLFTSNYHGKTFTQSKCLHIFRIK